MTDKEMLMYAYGAIRTSTDAQLKAVEEELADYLYPSNYVPTPTQRKAKDDAPERPGDEYLNEL